jgi:hypothetical protein
MDEIMPKRDEMNSTLRIDAGAANIGGRTP